MNEEELSAEQMLEDLEAWEAARVAARAQAEDESERQAEGQDKGEEEEEGEEGLEALRRALKSVDGSEYAAAESELRSLVAALEDARGDPDAAYALSKRVVSAQLWLSRLVSLTSQIESSLPSLVLSLQSVIVEAQSLIPAAAAVQ